MRFPLWLTWGEGVETEAVPDGAHWAHPALGRGFRLFRLRARPVLVQTGHVRDDDPAVDTGGM